VNIDPAKETGLRRKLQGKELHNLFTSSNNIRAIKSRRMKWMGHSKIINVFKISVGNPDGNKPLRRTGCGWKNITTDFKETV
jgi:hypothetical protein